MKLNPSIVRRLREARHWSQEQLAAAAGLGLRTVQRVEADGVASRGTRVCLAAALDTDVSAMLDASPSPSPSPSPVAAVRRGCCGSWPACWCLPPARRLGRRGSSIMSPSC